MYTQWLDSPTGGDQLLRNSTGVNGQEPSFVCEKENYRRSEVDLGGDRS